jgi:murein DD-endopeptidase MepM/ murein hydrolase activator NlpD
VSLPSLVSPVARPNFVVSGWGDDRSYRGAGKTHEGLDFRAKIGDPAFAVFDGVVKFSLRDPGPAGEMIVLQHPSGLLARYMHLSRRDVAQGQSVRQGQLIGLTGNSGIQNSSPHLHWDLRVLPEKLNEYVAHFGTPVGGFAGLLSGGIGVPAEPLVPVDAYSPHVPANAAKHGISMYKSSGIGMVLLLAAAGFAWWYFH